MSFHTGLMQGYSISFSWTPLQLHGSFFQLDPSDAGPLGWTAEASGNLLLPLDMPRPRVYSCCEGLNIRWELWPSTYVAIH